MYLVAITDWYSRKVLAWRLSNSLESSFCVDCVEEAFRNYGIPEIFNSDKGSQFTSDVFIGALREYPTLASAWTAEGERWTMCSSSSSGAMSSMRIFICNDTVQRRNDSRD
ncbi:MAG: transposase family protein [Chlorobaculum sp.]|nr:transposase family protein [Chlorobaculum sp.]